MLRELSMIIPIKENSHFLEEIIQYHTPTNINMYIMHDAIIPFILPEQYKNANIHYFHMPSTSIYERTIAAFSKISTEYCVIRGDRRHQSNTALAQCLDFIKNNSEYTSASGIWLYQNLSIAYGVELISKAGEAENTNERLKKQSLSYQPTYYNIQKTRLLRAYFDIVSAIEEKNNNLYYHECIHAFLTFFLGKTKQLDCLAGIIQPKQKPAQHSNQVYEVIDIMKDKKEAEFILDTIKKILSQYDFVYKDIDSAFEKYHDTLIKRYTLRGYAKKSEASKLRNSAYLEHLYSLLNSSPNTSNEEISDAFQVLLTANFYSSTKFDDIKHLFDINDFTEINNLHNMIKRLQA